MSVRELLRRNGCVPVVASRAIRLGRAIVHLPSLARHVRDGSLSAEYADAVARGVRHVAERTRTPLGSELTDDTEATLIGHALAGRTPTEIADHARAIAVANEPATEDDPDDSATPVAEDVTLNDLTWNQGDDGRLSGSFDLDVVTGERLISCIDAASRPRPLPDGSPDPRPAARRRADAFAQLLETASRAVRSDALIGPSTTEVILTVPTTAATGPGGELVPWRAPSLQWLGTVSQDTVSLLSCDAAVTRVGMDIDDAPVDITTTTRLFTGRVRKAVIARDQCCVKCGNPGSWTDVHHIVFHSDGGPTTCDNGCCAGPATSPCTSTAGRSRWGPTGIPGYDHPHRSTRNASYSLPTTAARSDSTPSPPDRPADQHHLHLPTRQDRSSCLTTPQCGPPNPVRTSGSPGTPGTSGGR
ncbi:HNH endonuclease signature motif containing protein [Williamsia deligens]|uniref:DUF222 domain-containing protein n=1 Tax=Williamsia deligens TaxID=321325 RepID=A0ABW3G797_9NOCA|nr:HNH endonuclease signature motif containing protein [Williamsia deligens]MCP2194495.1 protein of unknown function (DUF222) [Williamsia deligens]